MGSFGFREVILVILFVLCAVWSVNIGLDAALANKLLFFKPFPVGTICLIQP